MRNDTLYKSLEYARTKVGANSNQIYRSLLACTSGADKTIRIGVPESDNAAIDEYTVAVLCLFYPDHGVTLMGRDNFNSFLRLAKSARDAYNRMIDPPETSVEAIIQGLTEDWVGRFG